MADCRSPSSSPTTPEAAVRKRYAAGAQVAEAALYCAVSYDPKYLRAIPAEVIERDYGCGDPSKYLRPGETVLDLGSGTGKIAFIAAQVVGPTGRVIGIDMTDEMLEVARRNAPFVAEKIGYSNVEFLKARIQDLRGVIADESIDSVVSNCVLNLVDSTAKPLLFAEIFRVLKPDGQAVISDIVSSAPVPAHLQADPELWSGCISGALTIEEFLGAFRAAGFAKLEILARDGDPWQTVEGIDFRSVTLQAIKGEASSSATCCE